MLREDDSTWPFWLEDRGGGTQRLGVTEGWLEESGDAVIGLELAAAGSRIRRGDTFGFLHLAESTRELRAPFDLEVVAVNEIVLSAAALVREAPYGRGWLIELVRRQA